jgi:metallo-beta-lactamase family protein
MNFRIDDNIKVRFTSTGHMLGSAVATIQVIEKGQIKRIAYTGDIGRFVNRILAPPVPFPQSDVIITESTYGDRIHSDNVASEEELLSVLVETCVEKRGKLIIPAFSVGRTQEVVYALNSFFNQGRLPRVDIFVDSPLAVNATTVFRMHTECFNDDFRKVLESDSDPFGFSNLFYITRQEDSKKLNDHKKPCVIISASGMMEAGRVKHHLANNISDPKNTVLAVGYCSPETLGARILRGDKEVSIHGNVHKVNADIRRIESFSGHGDYREMISFLGCQQQASVEKLFLVHGEYETQKKYAERLSNEGFKNIEIPAKNQEFIVC